VPNLFSHNIWQHLLHWKSTSESSRRKRWAKGGWFFELQRRSKVRLNDVTTQVIHFRPHLINRLTSQRNEFQKSRAINISVYRRLEEFRESSETRELPAKSNEIRLTELVPEETYVAVFVEGIERKREGKMDENGQKEKADALRFINHLKVYSLYSYPAFVLRNFPILRCISC